MGKCVIIPKGILTLAKTEFQCPYCEKQYDDVSDEYLKRCNKNRSHIAYIKCECNNKFGMTYNIQGDAVSFKL